MSALGAGITPRLLKTYDMPTRKIFEEIDLKGDYLPAKKPDALKGMVWAALGSTLPLLLRGPKGLRRPQEAKEEYERVAVSSETMR